MYYWPQLSSNRRYFFLQSLTVSRKEYGSAGRVLVASSQPTHADCIATAQLNIQRRHFLVQNRSAVHDDFASAKRKKSVRKIALLRAVSYLCSKHVPSGLFHD